MKLKKLNKDDSLIFSAENKVMLDCAVFASYRVQLVEDLYQILLQLEAHFFTL